jgi:hypothetical protein
MKYAWLFHGVWFFFISRAILQEKSWVENIQSVCEV